MNGLTASATEARYAMKEEAAQSIQIGEVKSISVGKSTVRYLAAGRSEWRFNTLLTKEPETIEWIDSFDKSDTLWDIGANVGIYSIYAALRGISVIAVEPNFTNYFHLCYNIKLNRLHRRIMPLCLAFSSGKSVSTINLRSMEFGESMSTFGSDLDFRGRTYAPVFRQGMIAYGIDEFVTEFGVPVPNHLKIDVDGIELEIAKGGAQTFSNRRVKSVQVELVDSDPPQIQGVSSLLEGAGLAFVSKRHNDAAEGMKDVFNFLYRRVPE